jgi:hypothetical protein
LLLLVLYAGVIGMRRGSEFGVAAAGRTEYVYRSTTLVALAFTWPGSLALACSSEI